MSDDIALGPLGDHMQLRTKEGLEMSDDAKHTPGPWTFNETTREIVCRAGEDGGMVIADMAHWHPPSDLENIGNARLIAAAPEMYQALAGLARQWQRFCAGVGNQECAYYDLAKHSAEHWGAALDAIAKAEGR